MWLFVTPAGLSVRLWPQGLARVLRAYIDKAGIDRKRLTIYATDIGELPAILGAIEDPGIARAIVVGDFAPFDRPLLLQERLRALKEPATNAEVRKQLNATRDEILENATRRGLGPEKQFDLSPSFRADMAAGWTHGSITTADAFAAYYAQFTRDQNFLDANISRLKTPVMVVWGERDVCIDKAMGLEFAQRTRATFRLLPALGHYPHLQAPEIVPAEIRAIASHWPIERSEVVSIVSRGGTMSAAHHCLSRSASWHTNFLVDAACVARRGKHQIGCCQEQLGCGVDQKVLTSERSSHFDRMDDHLSSAARRSTMLQPNTPTSSDATSARASKAAPSARTQAPADSAIRPFRVHVAEEDLAELRRRLQTTRWPDKETVEDASQGAQLHKVQALVRYWGTDYDWRRGEAKLNSFPQFKTKIDGLEIHFIHVKSPHPGAMPLIITHGWPGSVFEQIKLIGPLTDPTNHGGRVEDAFDVVIPSLPGFGFSERPTEAGWNLDRIGAAWAVLMSRLGYKRYVAQGGDWGAGVVAAMGREAPAGLLGIHSNLPAVIIPEVGAALGGDPTALAALPEKERAAVTDLGAFLQDGGLSYVVMMGARPQAVSYGLTDSPAGLAGWMLVHSGFAKWSYGSDPAQHPTRDDVLDNFSFYWLTNSIASSSRIYWEHRRGNLIDAGDQRSGSIKLPVAITVFPDEVVRAQEAWARKAFPNLTYFHEVDRGGHFAMWEQPELFAQELRAAFKPLR